MPRVVERLVELFQIVEMRDGAIFKTRYVEDRWVRTDEDPPKGHLFVPLSTEREKRRMELNEPTMRSRVVETIEWDVSPFTPGG